MVIWFKNLEILLEYKLELYPDILDGKSVYPIILTPFYTLISSLTVYSQFPPVSAARSTRTLPGFIALIISLVIRIGAFLPGIKAVVIMISTSLAYYINNFISASINSGLISLAYPPAPSPDSLILTSKNSAPND